MLILYVFRKINAFKKFASGHSAILSIIQFFLRKKTLRHLNNNSKTL